MIGTTIGHYEILEKLGEGGMGVVYKATDTKLDRLVALKFLPDHVSAGSDELERFVQEAKAAAGLNHPNICTIHGIEEADKKHFIVMEFVDGQTLQEKKRSLSTKEALDVGIQIAEGLAAAHEKGIVHRDIKPENIMFRKDGRVQIMDFGLAKLRGASRLTKEGSTVGTAGYMSPEQVQGRDTDHRSDLFSLGVLLYEMLTGQAAFKGMHETAIAYEIVNVDTAPMSSIKPEIPPELDAIVLECLEKDPKERTQSASQVAVDLKRYRRDSSRSRASRITAARPTVSAARDASDAPLKTSADLSSNSWIMTGAIALAAAILGAVAMYFLLEEGAPSPVIRASIKTPPGLEYQDLQGGTSAICPDGSMIVFLGRDSSGTSRLHVRPLDSDALHPLPGTDGARYPFWSPDNKHIGFFAGGSIRTVAASGGPVVTVAEAPFGRGAAWSPSGDILFQPNLQDPNLYAVKAGGGAVRQVTTFDTTMKSVPRFPSFLPDGDNFLFSMLQTTDNKASVYLGSLKTGSTTKVLDDGMTPFFANGQLLFVRQQILMAQPFDPSSPEQLLQPTPIQGNLNTWPPRAKADFSVSATGLILYSGAAANVTDEDEILWIDDRGVVHRELGVADLFGTPRLSHDGERIAYGQGDPAGGVDVWIYDIRRKVRTRLTFVAPNSAATGPVWSSDDRMIFYNSEEMGGKAAIYRRAADGSGEATLVIDGGRDATSGYYPLDESPDGRYLLFAIKNELRSAIALIDLRDPDRKFEQLVQDGDHARFSPDGKWYVYETGTTGSQRVVVAQFRGRPGTWQVSSTDGYLPYWVGNRILFRSPSASTEMVVDVSFRDGSPVFGQSRPYFPSSGSTFLPYRTFGFSEKKNAIVAFKPSGLTANNQLSLIINWPGLAEE